MKRFTSNVLALSLLCSVTAGRCTEPTASSIINTAQKLADSRYKGYKYGSDDSMKQVNCVMFIGELIETLLNRVLSKEERDSVYINYPIKDFEAALTSKDPRMGGVSHAVESVLKVGIRVTVSDVQAGDFIQYWMKSKKGTWFGHSAIISKVLKIENGIPTVSIFGAHQSTNGITETDFKGTGLILGGKDRFIFLSRITPEHIHLSK